MMDAGARARYRLPGPFARVPLILVVVTLALSAACAAAGLMYGRTRDIPEPATTVEVRSAPRAAQGDEIVLPTKLELPGR